MLYAHASSTSIYQAMKSRHKDGRWTDFPNPPVQAEVLDWWFQFQEEQTSDSAHDWKDVRVIGELKESNRDKNGTLLQISRYVRDAFSCQPTRRYVHAFTICGRPFDIHDEPERFIQVITGYTRLGRPSHHHHNPRSVSRKWVSMEDLLFSIPN
ncbi:hypothetical protein F5883DRAFT_439246 [Diaporthe sp. PMI_573]|nr:hypothetical protein F5883DRAFT_439673 [Diaporthaceae sp. PMI_573]KAH8745097.1 hypothetical protein F5883DRAFT_439246 [Diaporthaceae sp. PMI_573]